MTKLKEGIFRLHTRRFGTVAELIVQKILDADMSKALQYDLTKNGKRIECKFSRCQEENKIKINKDTVLDAIYAESDRDVSFDDCYDKVWDCNIQQVKRTEFDELVYGVFFSDALVIFKISPSEIDSRIGYSDKQHRGNVGEGQFHITNKNFGYHLDNYLYKILTYKDIEECLARAQRSL
jgi:hypothetical protein